jgi:hypothetical protein
MSAVDLLLRGRAAAEALMIDTCAITRRSGPLATDPVTGKATAASTPIYSGKCKVQSKDSATSTPEAGEHSFTIVSRQVHIPANAADIKDGDLITITASALNAFTVGKKYVVEGFTPDSFDTAARLPVREMTS